MPCINNNHRAFVCIDVFEKRRPVLLVARPDGDWCMVCGDQHEDTDAFRVVGICHVLADDPTIEDTLDLPQEWEAERLAVGSPWIQRPIED
jgi:hypothetical protein